MRSSRHERGDQRGRGVLNNLPSNAARYSPETSPITINVVREGLHVAISVTDEGRGVTAEELPNLFRNFSRLESEDQSGRMAETGLGCLSARA